MSAALASALSPVSFPLVPPAVGFSGSRSLPATWAPIVGSLVSSLPPAVPLLVGDAAGADAFVRAACPRARVFVVGGVRSASALVARSVALVRALVDFGPGACLVAFAGSPCPTGVAPAAAWRSGSSPSGTWSSAALVVGLGASLVVAWCAPGTPALPAWPRGAWSPLPALPWGGTAPCSLFAWSPALAAGQLPLF